MKWKWELLSVLGGSRRAAGQGPAAGRPERSAPTDVGRELRVCPAATLRAGGGGRGDNLSSPRDGDAGTTEASAFTNSRSLSQASFPLFFN